MSERKEELVTVEFKIPKQLYDEVSVILAEQGLTVEEVLVLFLKETVRLGRIPFEYTQQDLEEAWAMDEYYSKENRPEGEKPLA